MTNAEVALDIIENMSYKAWINHPSTLQRLHRFHGRTGVVITNELGAREFYFMPRDPKDRAISIVVHKAEISRGWPETQPAAVSATEPSAAAT